MLIFFWDPPAEYQSLVHYVWRQRGSPPAAPRLLSVYLPVNANASESSGGRRCVQGPAPLMCLLVIPWLLSLSVGPSCGRHAAERRCYCKCQRVKRPAPHSHPDLKDQLIRSGPPRYGWTPIILGSISDWFWLSTLFMKFNLCYIFHRSVLDCEDVSIHDLRSAEQKFEQTEWLSARWFKINLTASSDTFRPDSEYFTEQ